MRGRLDPHARYRELLAARLDRPLTRAENRLLVGHLKGCAACRQVERDYRDQSALLRSMPAPLPPRDMWARTATALDREMSRRSIGYPRSGRRVLVRAGRTAGTPSALATVVAALGVVTALVALQLVPTLRPATTGEGPPVGSAVALRPTPFSVRSEPLSLVAANSSDLTFYETQVDLVCPETAPDCLDDNKFVEHRVEVPSLDRLQNATLSGAGRVAFVGHGKDRDVIAVVLLESDEAPPSNRPVRPSDPPTPSQTPRHETTPAGSPTASATDIKPPTSPGVGETPTATANSTPSATPSSTAAGTPATPPSETPTSTPTADVTPSPASEDTPTPDSVASPLTDVPPASAVAGMTVVSILEDVHSAGAPPAWSRDGEVLAFSAMPADGSYGPDVYVWQPGDATATAITNDHSSFFASWSGRRIVFSRLVGGSIETGSTVDIVTNVIDPETLEERTVEGPQMWLPVVDPSRSYAVAWQGTLDVTDRRPTLVEGALYLVDSAAVNPFRADDGDALADTETDAVLEPLNPDRDPARNPVLDWNARWSTDGLILGVWEAEVATETWGTLSLIGLDSKSGTLNVQQPLLQQLAKRDFALGSDRVAWIGPSNIGTAGELRIKTWGADGVGDLRITSPSQEELVPAF